MANYFSSPIYNVTTAKGEKVSIDVTNSISSGLGPNQGLVKAVTSWMRAGGYSTVLDFGAGALRHSIPLLKAGFEVIAVEYERAYQRPKAQQHRDEAVRLPGFTQLVWPHDFLKCKLKYDVALLVYVLQVIPVKKERNLVLNSISRGFERYGPRRLYYASRFGDASSLPPENKHNDGWVKGVAENDRSFYTEWDPTTTDKIFNDCHFQRVSSYSGATQSYIYQFKPGIL
jgi:hypothetical protein